MYVSMSVCTRSWLARGAWREETERFLSVPSMQETTTTWFFVLYVFLPTRTGAANFEIA